MSAARNERNLQVKSLAESGVAITGGTAGIGLASAKAFCAAGVRRLVLLGRSPERGAAACAAVNQVAPTVNVRFVQVDAGSDEAVARATTEAREILGSIDVLVNSVSGEYKPELLVRTPPGEIADVLARVALPPIHMTRAVLPWMCEQRGGSIVNIASDAAKVATPGESVIGAGMAAIVMFSRALALEAKRDGVRVNAITPSLVSGTETTDRILKDGFSAKLFAKATTMASLGVASPEDIAELAVFLGGPASARLTGQAVSVNGGIAAA
jgi:2-hydroxycyclohexanecarboxyl-CoA dehydrogenase